MERVYGWFGVSSPQIPGEVKQMIYHIDGSVAGQLSESTLVSCQWDAGRRLMTLSRTTDDDLPLYYLCRHGQLFFSSHLPWLLSQLGPVASAIDMNCLADLAIVGFVAAPRTQYRDIFQLPPAAQLQWYWGEAEPEVALLQRLRAAPPAIGVTLRQEQSRKAPDITQLSDSVMMYNAIPHSAAILGESHGDLALLRLLLHMRHLRADAVHFRFGSCVSEPETSALQRLAVPWLKRRWQRGLLDYWKTTRVPEIARWFIAENTMSEVKWLSALITSEQQRMIRLMAQAYQQHTEFYYSAKEMELHLSDEQVDDSFNLDAPEAGNLFCQAVLLGKSSVKMKQYLKLSPKKLQREWDKKNNRQLAGMICAILSLDYLDKFYCRLPY
ncbi:hypothetical protein [Aeromonas hydrophila]|uniref:hypothetical protein n=1 Tax=Aeromonas hydrophila TaxID=644 RepID=UPI001890881A|nr:hypothetical protein [Aeromonas hydrophila]MBF4801480.1 hypothetical protein [Aeromonas hydrophila]